MALRSFLTYSFGVFPPRTCCKLINLKPMLFRKGRSQSRPAVCLGQSWYSAGGFPQVSKLFFSFAELERGSYSSHENISATFPLENFLLTTICNPLAIPGQQTVRARTALPPPSRINGIRGPKVQPALTLHPF
jgi:hypothetical protein